MKNSSSSSSGWLVQTIFVTFSEEFEHKLLIAGIKNVVNIKSKQMSAVVSEYEKVKHILHILKRMTAITI